MCINVVVLWHIRAYWVFFVRELIPVRCDGVTVTRSLHAPPQDKANLRQTASAVSQCFIVQRPGRTRADEMMAVTEEPSPPPASWFLYSAMIDIARPVAREQRTTTATTVILVRTYRLFIAKGSGNE